MTTDKKTMETPIIYVQVPTRLGSAIEGTLGDRSITIPVKRAGSIENAKTQISKRFDTLCREQKEEGEWLSQFKGLTTDELISHECYAYSRYKKHGVSIYAKCPFSPSGVYVVGTMTHQEALSMPSVLSPTESLATHAG